MFSTGEVYIVPPTPISDPDAALIAEIDTGSMLLDLDLMQEQQRHARFASSPSPSFSGFGYPPSPDMHGLSFYPEPLAFTPSQPMGPELNEIEENEVVRLLMREMIPDILADCQKLNLHPNLYMWTPEDVQKWIACIIARFELGEVHLQNFFMSGLDLGLLQDADFRQRAPKCGDILHSIVYILKSSIQDHQQASQVVPQVALPVHIAPQLQPIQTAAPHFPATPRYPAPTSPQRDCDSGSTGSPSDDEGSIPSPAPSGPNTSMTPNHTGGIQLWQFLKELLLQPNSYSYCIRWIDRSHGIFKIEDSVEVARLWGMRKNRPAMNYDKLSRSIRQYYRKGIMKKTEVSQRLVYQFVHPC